MKFFDGCILFSSCGCFMTRVAARWAVTEIIGSCWTVWSSFSSFLYIINETVMNLSGVTVVVVWSLSFNVVCL